ncbi:DUF2290 domain-containing protein [Mesorhizobium sp. LNHC209A00]|uniref:DUF2290 domain-containing protein n=1 Tax=Mesorhizobium TaxID=68287 RepID=UPI0003D062C7|nr:DUF2290 domain-containing protein [Mesorhizobium sp. LNHC209A00]ESY99373.1 hypothetical protein X738_08865 [Mesorhizobium sp. LNHC209A00]
MNRDYVRADIAKGWTFLKTLELGQIFSNPMPIVSSEEFRDSALNHDESYENLYLTGLRQRDYNILLLDFSFLQIGISEEHHVRYGYYPNPFLGSSERAIAELGELHTYVDEGLISIEGYLAKIGELRRSQHAPLLRYENAPSQYREYIHPCSHFHMGHHDTNRWPLQRVLTPLAFCMIVARQFYSGSWFSAGEITLFGKRQVPDGFLEDVKEDCRILGDDLFSSKEARLFAFT